MLYAPSHLFIAASASFCTASTVESTTPEAARRSEQWKPSPIAIVCDNALGCGLSSEDTVDSLHGSPGMTMSGALSSLETSHLLCPFAKKSLSISTFQPSYLEFVSFVAGGFAVLNVSGNQYVH